MPQTGSRAQKQDPHRSWGNLGASPQLLSRPLGPALAKSRDLSKAQGLPVKLGSGLAPSRGFPGLFVVVPTACLLPSRQAFPPGNPAGPSSLLPAGGASSRAQWRPQHFWAPHASSQAFGRWQPSHCEVGGRVVASCFVLGTVSPVSLLGLEFAL